MSTKGLALLAATLQLISLSSSAQHADTADANVHVQVYDNQSEFQSDLRSLHKIPGAPAPFYTYFWEFGDGKFSFVPRPRHIYADTGNYNVRLYATNNYDDGKPPPTRPRPIRINSKTMLAGNAETPFFKQDASIEMKVNRMPKPDEDMVLIIGYRNHSSLQTMKGSLLLFYNERQFSKKSFDLTEERPYYHERRSTVDSLMAYLPNDELIESTAFVDVSPRHGPNSSSNLVSPVFRQMKFADLFASKMQQFEQNSVWRFDNLGKDEEKYFFLTLHTKAEMIRDTNAVVTLTGMFVPDNADAEIEQYEMELQIVASHDPNRMLLKNRRLDYRFTGTKKELNYRVIFQNIGAGPARQIDVGIGVPSMVDPQSVEILDYYPKCPLCNASATQGACLEKVYKKDSIHFIFKNVFLPGILKDGMKDPDSTRGFVKYRVHFNNKLKKLPFESRATIVFDGQEPVFSNPSTGTFRPGQSWGLMGGYGLHLGTLGSDEASDNNISIGVSLSPYAPYRKYLQAELFLGYQDYPEKFSGQNTFDTLINGSQYTGFASQFQKNKAITLDIVPLELRYNLNDWLGVGAGTQVSTDAVTIVSPSQQLFLFDSTGMNPIIRNTKPANYTRWFNKWDIAAFADLQIGKLRSGPALGIRYLYYLLHPQNRLFIYAVWRL